MARRRVAVRGVVLTPDGRLLLQQGQDPFDPSMPPCWFLPGGGIESGESPAEALRRELLEECGLREVEVGPVLWQQHAAFRFAGIDFDQEEHVVLARVPGAVDIRPTALDAVEVMAFRGARWWPVGEVGATSDVVYPVDLARRLRESGLLRVADPG